MYVLVESLSRSSCTTFPKPRRSFPGPTSLSVSLFRDYLVAGGDDLGQGYVSIKYNAYISINSKVCFLECARVPARTRLLSRGPFIQGIQVTNLWLLQLQVAHSDYMKGE